MRLGASIYTGTVRAYDVVTMLQRDGHPTALGEAIAMYGRIFKTLHILSYIDTDETYRRDIKGIRNLQEGRHALARKICHGKKGELYHRYERGLEDPLTELPQRSSWSVGRSTDSDRGLFWRRCELSPGRSGICCHYESSRATRGGRDGRARCGGPGCRGVGGAAGRPGRGDRRPAEAVPADRRRGVRGGGGHRVSAPHARRRRQPGVAAVVCL